MLRKYTAIAFVFVAYSLLLLHSFIPHHHDHEMEAAVEHHDSHDHNGDTDEHDDIDQGFLPHAFAHFQHDQGIEIVYTHYTTHAGCSSVNHVMGFIPSSAFFIIKAIHPPPLIPVFSPPLFFTNTHLPASDLLRGPPAFLSA